MTVRSKVIVAWLAHSMTLTLKGKLVNTEQYMPFQFPYHYAVCCTGAPPYCTVDTRISFHTLRFNHSFLWALKLINSLYVEIKQPGMSGTHESVEKTHPVLIKSLSSKSVTYFFSFGYSEQILCFMSKSKLKTRERKQVPKRDFRELNWKKRRSISDIHY